MLFIHAFAGFELHEEQSRPGEQLIQLLCCNYYTIMIKINQNRIDDHNLQQVIGMLGMKLFSHFFLLLARSHCTELHSLLTLINVLKDKEKLLFVRFLTILY